MTNAKRGLGGFLGKARIEGQRHRRPTPRSKHYRPRLEVLEERTLLSGEPFPNNLNPPPLL